MRKLKQLYWYFKLKKQGYTKQMRIVVYAMRGLITFEEYEKIIEKKNNKGE